MILQELPYISRIYTAYRGEDSSILGTNEMFGDRTSQEMVGKWIYPPIGSTYHLFLPSGGLCATYHLLGEPETTIDKIAKILQSRRKKKHTKNSGLTHRQKTIELSSLEEHKKFMGIFWRPY